MPVVAGAARVPPARSSWPSAPAWAENIGYYIFTAFVLVYATGEAGDLAEHGAQRGCSSPLPSTSWPSRRWVRCPTGSAADRCTWSAAVGVGVWGFVFFALIDSQVVPAAGARRHDRPDLPRSDVRAPGVLLLRDVLHPGAVLAVCRWPVRCPPSWRAAWRRSSPRRCCCSTAAPCRSRCTSPVPRCSPWSPSLLSRETAHSDLTRDPAPIGRPSAPAAAEPAVPCSATRSSRPTPRRRWSSTATPSRPADSSASGSPRSSRSRWNGGSRGHSLAAGPHPGLRGGSGGRRHARAEPLRGRGMVTPGHRRALGARAEPRRARARRRDRGVLLAAGRDHATCSGRSPRPPRRGDQGRARHVRRPAPRGRPDERSAPPRSWSSSSTLRGEEHLFFPAQPIHVALLRGTTADPEGNITMEREALTLEVLSMAQAAKNSGGVVIVQVERVTERRHAEPARGEDPGHPGRRGRGRRSPANHGRRSPRPTTPPTPARSRRRGRRWPPMPLDARKVIARRAAMFLRAERGREPRDRHPEGVAAVAAEERILDLITLTVEPGGIGGIPAGGLSFGAVANPQAIIDQPYQFDFYDGGGLDQAFLGMAEADAARQRQRQPVRSQGRRCGRLHQHQPERQGGLLPRHLHAPARRCRCADGAAASSTSTGATEVRRPGRAGDLQRRARRRTRSVRATTSPSAASSGSPRRASSWSRSRPGSTSRRDVLAQHGVPTRHQRRRSCTMDAAHLPDRPMGLRRPAADRAWTSASVTIAATDTVYVNFEGLRLLHRRGRRRRWPTELDRRFADLGQRVHVVVNYDNFDAGPRCGGHVLRDGQAQRGTLLPLLDPVFDQRLLPPSVRA